MFCPYCSHQLSSRAVFCPRCGEPLPAEFRPPRRRWPIVALAAFLIVVVFGSGVALVIGRPAGGRSISPTQGRVEVTTASTNAAHDSPTHTPGILAESLPPTNEAVADLAAAPIPTSMPAPTKTVAPSPSPAPTKTLTPSATPSPSPTPGPPRIVFQSNRDGDYELFIMDVDGGRQTQLTFNEVDDRLPAVSPDHHAIAFQSEWDGDVELYLIDLDGQNQRRLTHSPGYDGLAAWSPDGQQIAFVSERDGDQEVFVMNSDGSNQRQLTFNELMDGHVSWSVNHQLVFNSGTERGSSWEIYVMETDGANQRQLTDNGVSDWSPEWSPDGRSILFLSIASGNDPGIYIMDADGRNRRLFYNSRDYEWGARWSPDGQFILFTVDIDNVSYIYLLSAAGGQPYFISARGSYPAWVGLGLDVPGPPPGLAAASAPTAPPCQTSVGPRWGTTLWPLYQERLGCALTGEARTTAAYQLYDNGLAVWRQDADRIYHLYNDGSYTAFSDDSPAGYYDSNLLKGGFGYLWNADRRARDRLGDPIAAEAIATNFAVQDFVGGLIFYFLEAQARNYILLADEQTWVTR